MFTSQASAQSTPALEQGGKSPQDACPPERAERPIHPAPVATEPIPDTKSPILKGCATTMDMITVWNTFATYVRARFGKDERGASLVECTRSSSL